MKILVVDDSPFMRQAVIKALSETKYKTSEIAQAGDGKEALKQFKAGGIDWVLCDWNMPGMNGLDFLIEARKIKTPKHVPILMVTREGTMSKMEQALEQGADRYVVKPFTAADIERGMDLAALKMAAKP